MKKFIPILFISLFFLLTNSIPEASARAGRGRSFGPSRMQSRSFGARNYESPYRNNYGPQGSAPVRNQSSFLKSVAGGVAGGMLGGLLFRSLSGNANTGVGGVQGGGGIDFFGILLLAGLGFFLFKLFTQRRGNQEFSSAGRNESLPRPEGKFFESSSSSSSSSSTTSSSLWRDNESIHKEKWTDIFFNIQAAWSRGDLSAVAPSLTNDIQRFLQEELDQLALQGLKNTIDNIAVRAIEVKEDWLDSSLEHVVVKFNANLVDYTINLKTNDVVEGSKTQSIRFEELWTFVRESSHQQDWKLEGIEQV